MILVATGLGACAPTGKAGDTAPVEAGIPAPRLEQPDSPTSQPTIRIRGYATPGHRIELFVNGVLRGDEAARSDGVFEFPAVPLDSGGNVITAVAVDSLGNRSPAHPSGGARGEPGSRLRDEVSVMRSP